MGSVYDAIPFPDPQVTAAEKYRGAEARTKTYVASLASWEEVGWMLCVEAWRRGYPKARAKLFISDGAEALRTLRQTHFPDASFILDWYHGTEHLSDCGKAAFGEGTERAEAWYDEMKDQLWEGKVDAILQAIEKESSRVGKPVPGESETSPRVTLHRNLHYFAQNRDGMAYPRFREQGWPLASGIAEGGVKQIGMRVKGSEKFWNNVGSGQGAEEMLALCALFLSEDGRWDAHWEARARPYRRDVLLE